MVWELVMPMVVRMGGGGGGRRDEVLPTRLEAENSPEGRERGLLALKLISSDK